MLYRRPLCAAVAALLLLPETLAAQTAPSVSWRDHVRACLPDQASGRTHLNNIPEPSGSTRLVATQSGLFGGDMETWRVAAWRVDCPNAPQFPLLALRVLSAETTGRSFVSKGLRLDELGAVTQQSAQTRFTNGFSQRSFPDTGPTENSLSPQGGQTVVVAFADNPGFVMRDAFTLAGGTAAGTLSFPAVGPGVGGGNWPLTGRLSGTYFDPARSGEGILVDFSRLGDGNDHVFLSWYTYDDAGNQKWIVGNVAYAPGIRSVRMPLLVTRGARFGTAFRADDVQRTIWGEATLTFPDCKTVVMDWTRTATGERGSYRMTRVGEGPAGSSCY